MADPTTTAGLCPCGEDTPRGCADRPDGHCGGETTQPAWIAAWTAFEWHAIESWDCAFELPDRKEIFREGWNAGVLAAVNEGAERDDKLWCVHILGPDDVIAYPDRASAEHDAALINEAMAQHVARNPPADGWPMLMAVVELWPHNAESHAEDLARNIRLEERDGNA